MASTKDRKFDLEIEELRLLIQASTKPFPNDKKAQQERIRRADKDLDFFGRTYFPHYIAKPSSAFHKYICRRLPEMVERSIETGLGDKEANAAPRGNAKSTWTTFVFYLWCIVKKKRRFPVIVGDTDETANGFLENIKLELEENERLAQDYPDACGRGRMWTKDTIITRNRIKVKAVGMMGSWRGMKFMNWRPDLVGCDDIENDEAVESPEQRKKLKSRFEKKLLKLGNKATIYMVHGTILHYDSLLSELLLRPGWKGYKFQAIIKYSDSALWNDWELIFADISVGKEEAERRADAFFEAHREEMLRGTECLWPEEEDYYYLMKMRVTDGPASFDSEKQNEPINPEDAVFLEEWFQDWEEGDVDLAGVPHAGAVDPSLGKKNKSSDPSAILGGRMKTKILYLDTSDIQVRRPDKIMTDILLHHARDPFDKLRMETVQFQEFFARQFEQLAHDQGLTINIDDFQPNTDKDLRIVRLQPWIKNGWIRFKKGDPGMLELKRHLKYFRLKNKGGKDDGPDGLEMLLGLCEVGLIPAMAASSSPSENDYHAARPNKFGVESPEFGVRRFGVSRMIGRIMGRMRG